MRPISEKRARIETEPHTHKVNRGLLGGLHYENLKWLQKILAFFLKITRLERKGRLNTHKIRLEAEQIEFENLGKQFDGVKFLLITDLHFDGITGIDQLVQQVIADQKYDYCILGGDYTFDHNFDPQIAKGAEHLMNYLRPRSPVFAILGNHDTYRMAELLDNCGAKVLINEARVLDRGDDKIFLAGVDDFHYYRCDDLDIIEQDFQKTINKTEKQNIFKILLSHTPELYKQAAMHDYDLMLSGHTHGGQICMPCGFAPVRGATVPRKMVRGKWKHGKLKGYTSPGAGSSGIAVRFFCPPAVSLIELKRKIK